MNIRAKVIFYLLAALAAVFPLAAQAHVLKTDGSIGVVLHVDPEDDPIIGQPATFFFEIKDKDNKFDPAKCQCTASVLRDNSTLFSTQLFQTNADNSLSAPLFSYTFSERAVYTIQLKGQPNNGGNFQAFNLSYDVRVDREPSGSAAPAPTQSGGHLLHYVLFGGGFAAFFAYQIWDNIRRRRAKGKSAPPQKAVLGIVALMAIFGLLFHNVHLATAFCHADGQQADQHQCCLPQLANTATIPNTIWYSRFYDRAVFEPVIAYFVPARVVNNKSPPSTTVV